MEREMNKAANSPPLKWLYVALTTTIVVVYWPVHLFRGFWTDEAGSYWISHSGFRQVWHNLQIYPGQSAIYSYLISLFISDGPYKEALLRLPSVAGGVLAAWLLYKLTESIVGKGSGFLAVVPYCCAGVIVEWSTYARPYALGMVVVLASFWSLREWVHTGRKTPWFIYCATSALVVYFHYLFTMIFLVQIIYLVAARRYGRNFLWTRVVAAAVIIAVAALPLAAQFRHMFQRSSLLNSSIPPTFDLLFRIYPLEILTVAAVAGCLFRVLYPQWFSRRWSLPTDDVVLLMTWMLAGPIIIFVVTRTTGLGLFSMRYLLYAVLPFFILLAWAIQHIQNDRARFALVAAVALNAPIHLYGIGLAEWRTPLATIHQVAGEDTPILLRSGFIESTYLDMSSEPNPATYLYAPLIAYPVRNPVIPVPFFLGSEAEHEIETRIRKLEPSHRRFCLMAETTSDTFYSLSAWFTANGYVSTKRIGGGFTVFFFERSSPLAKARN
jgi:uncharacterized membrane protein